MNRHEDASSYGFLSVEHGHVDFIVHSQILPSLTASVKKKNFLGATN
jgi:hypothetical protein